MRGFPLQTAEEMEAGMDQQDDDARDRELLNSGIDKIARKYEHLHPSWRIKHGNNVMLKITVGELRVLRQFHRKHHDT